MKKQRASGKRAMALQAVPRAIPHSALHALLRAVIRTPRHALRRAATVAALFAAPLAPALAQVDIDAPHGGWRHSDATQKDFLQEVHYPAAVVNVEGKDLAGQIRGRIRDRAKHPETGPREPGTLVVDGVAMPLSTDADGSFARPWSFGTGSHSVEVRGPGPDGPRKRMTFYETQEGRVATRLRVVLTWDTDQTDLDLHVISPDGAHVFYGDRVASNGGALDVDVTTGFGPEIYANPSPPPGVYQVYVNYYGAGDRDTVITVAQVEVIDGEGTPQEKRQSFRMPMRRPGELTHVGSFVVR